MLDIPRNRRLSDNFTYGELIHSATAIENSIGNDPVDESQYENLKALCVKVLQPIRGLFFKPIIITSGFRSWALNQKVKGARNSQHLFGEAADIRMREVPTVKLARAVAEAGGIPFDQLIYEVKWSRNRKAFIDWIHVSHKRVGGNRGQVLTIFKGMDARRHTFKGIHSVAELLKKTSAAH